MAIMATPIRTYNCNLCAGVFFFFFFFFFLFWWDDFIFINRFVVLICSVCSTILNIYILDNKRRASTKILINIKSFLSKSSFGFVILKS